jgi:hypothetical protein
MVTGTGHLMTGQRSPAGGYGMTAAPDVAHRSGEHNICLARPRARGQSPEWVVVEPGHVHEEARRSVSWVWSV